MATPSTTPHSILLTLLCATLPTIGQKSPNPSPLSARSPLTSPPHDDHLHLRALQAEALLDKVAVIVTDHLEAVIKDQSHQALQVPQVETQETAHHHLHHHQVATTTTTTTNQAFKI